MSDELPAPGTGMLVIELQNDLCGPHLVEERGLPGALARAVRDRGLLERLPPLLDACRARGVPVMYATKERDPGRPAPAHPPIARAASAEQRLIRGTPGAQVVDAVAPQPSDILLPRLDSLDPSHGSDLWTECERLGLTTLVVAGISTTIAVEGTVRGAANRAFRVLVAEDCCASVPDDWHRFSVEHILPLLAEVTTSGALIEALTRHP